MNAKKSVELVGFARIDFPNGTQPTADIPDQPDAPLIVDQRGYEEVGAAIAGSPIGVRGAGVYTTLQYKFRQYTNYGKDGDMHIDGTCTDLTDADGNGIPDACQGFGNSASSGLDRMQEIAA